MPTVTDPTLPPPTKCHNCLRRIEARDLRGTTLWGHPHLSGDTLCHPENPDDQRSAEPLPPPTNPDVLTLAVAAAAKVCDRFPDLAESIWLDGIDVEWTYHSFLSEPFYARATPVVCPLNVPVVVA